MPEKETERPLHLSVINSQDMHLVAISVVTGLIAEVLCNVV